MPNSIYGSANPFTARQQKQQKPQPSSDVNTTTFINQANGILSDLLKAGPRGKQTSKDRLVVLSSMLNLKIKAMR